MAQKLPEGGYSPNEGELVKRKDTNNSDVAIREFIESKLDERDRFYKVRIDAVEAKMDQGFLAAKEAVAAALAAAKEAVAAALLAAKEAVAAAFAASEKAVLKTEDAQRELNVKNNEFRLQLKDQAETLMPRLETQAMFKNFDDKLSSIVKNFEDKFTALKLDVDIRDEKVRKELSIIRENQSGSTGKSGAYATIWAVGVSLVAILIALLTYLKK